MSEINHFNFFIMCSGDVAADVDHLHVKKIYLEPLVGHLYIVREDEYYHITKFLIEMKI
jgi:hypothetical protein